MPVSARTDHFFQGPCGKLHVLSFARDGFNATMPYYDSGCSSMVTLKSLSDICSSYLWLIIGIGYQQVANLRSKHTPSLRVKDAGWTTARKLAFAGLTLP